MRPRARRDSPMRPLRPATGSTRRFAFLVGALLIAIGTLAAEAGKRPYKILILGDSLTEGLGVEKEDAYPALLDAELKAWKPGCCEVINGGSSGSTSASAVRRLQWYAKANPDLVVLALGSNDGLRGVKPAETRKNIEAAIRFCRERHWDVALAGLKVPPNYGPEYAAAFAGIFPDLAAAYHLPLMPFLLAGVAGEPGLNQADGIHPNEKGHRVLADSVFAFLKPILERRLPAPNK
jgi:acyl-CoA thioesterase-1